MGISSCAPETQRLLLAHRVKFRNAAYSIPALPLFRSLRCRRPAFRKKLLHPRRNAIPSHLVEPERVDARILVLVFDLVAALLDVERHRALLAGLDAEERAPLLHCERITQSADPGGEVARREIACVEMLVELPVGWWKYHAVLPVEPPEVFLGLIPQQRIAVAGDAHDVEAGPVAVAFLVRADRHFGDVGVHGSVGEYEHDVGPAGAAIAPGFQLDGGEIGDEIGLPHVIAGPDRDEIAFAGKIFILAGARGEFILGSE